MTDALEDKVTQPAHDVVACLSAGGVIDRDTALKMLATDKAIRAL